MISKLISTAAVIAAGTSLAIAAPAMAAEPTVQAAHSVSTHSGSADTAVTGSHGTTPVKPKPAEHVKVKPAKHAKPTAAETKAIKYADGLIGAWGMGSHKVVMEDSSTAVEKTMFAFAGKGGKYWMQTSFRTIGKITNVSFRDEITRVAVVVRVDDPILAKSKDHAVVDVRFTQKQAADASQYAQQMMEAFAAHNNARMRLLARPDVAKQLIAFKDKAHTEWVRSGDEGAAGTIYVTYTNTVLKQKLTLGVNDTINLTGAPHAVVTARFERIK